MMAGLDLAGAIRESLAQEMRREQRIVVLGEGVGSMGGVFHTTEGLLDEFGAERVMEMPIEEGALLGAAVGMALYGLRPVPEIPFADFVYPGFDQIVSEMAKMRFRSGGQYAAPVVLRVPCGGGVGGGMYQSQSPEAYFCHTPGLLVATPSTPHDAAGLLRTALRGDDPVIFLEPKALYATGSEQMPEEDFSIPFGTAARLRSGDDVTVVAYGAMVEAARAAAEAADGDGIGVDLLDLRTLVPYDIAALLKSVAKTGRVVLVQEAPRMCGFAAELAAVIAEKAVFHLQAPVLRVSGYDTPFPYALERTYLPDEDRVLDAIRRAAAY